MKEEVVYCRDGNPLVSIAARVGGVINIVFAVFFACGWVTTNINTIGKDWSGFKSFLAEGVAIATWAGGLALSAHVIESFWKESSTPTALYLETKLARWLVVASAFVALAVFSFGMFFVKLAFIESLILAAATLGASLLSQQVICAICVVPTSSLKPQASARRLRRSPQLRIDGCGRKSYLAWQTLRQPNRGIWRLVPAIQRDQRRFPLDGV